MNTRILIAAAWLVSVAAAYFIGGSGSAKPTTDTGGKSSAATASANANAAGEPGSTSRPGVARAFGDPDELTADGKKNVAAIIARARAEMAGGMGGMMNMRGMLKAIAPLADLDPAQIQEALAEVEKAVKEPQQRMMFYSLLLGQWAETDGKAALDYADSKLAKNPMFEMGIRASVIGAWARSNPDAAWKWFESERPNLSGNRNGQMMVSMIFGGMVAAGKLDAAMTRLDTLGTEERMMAINGIANSASSSGMRQRLLDRMSSLPDDQRKAFRQGIIGQWTVTDPDEALKWLRSLPAEEQRPLRESAAQSVLWMNPAKGAEIMLENAEPKDLPRLYDRVVGAWANSDLRAAGDWLTKQPQGPELDNARMTYAAISSQKDPAAGMDWARSVTDPEQRVNSIGQVYSNWRAKDAKAADAALAASGLNAEDMQKVQQRAAETPKVIPGLNVPQPAPLRAR